MRTLLVLAPHPRLPEDLRAGLNPENYRIIHRTTLEDAEPLLGHGLVDVCIMDVELANVQGIWLLEKLHRRASKCPVIIYTGPGQSDWEEEAYLQGATHVLAKPVRIRMLNALLERLWESSPGESSAIIPFPPANGVTPAGAATPSAANVAPSLGVLRDFSAILTHSLNTEGMLKQFLLLVRELLGVNRAAIFLLPPPVAFGAGAANEGHRLRSACAIGLSSNLLQHFELSLDGGIGGYLSRLGRILRRNSEEARNDVEARKEFEVLGVEVAIPILDRETILGAAVFDARITGEPLVNAELELIFHLLEQLGLAIKNIQLHDQLAGNNEMLAGILRELSSACVVVNRDLAILHANKTARRYFGGAARRADEMEFSDLPQVIGSKVYQVLKTGSAITNLKYEPEDSPGTIYNINIVPFQKQPGAVPASALLMAEDLTQSEQLRRLELEAGSLRLVKSMADRLTHEIGNAMVPLSTHQQLLADKWKDAEFRASLDVALAEGVKRVTRLINQMRFLARDSLISPEAFPLAPLLEEAYQEARKYQPAKAAQLKYDVGKTPIVVTGDRAALKHALAEVMLNALQANPADPKIGVRFQSETNGGQGDLQIEVQDNGTGFSAEAAQQASLPFFTTRNVGLGLGLTVTRKIVETHHGKLEIVAPKSGQAGVVRISLPLEPKAQ